MKYGVSYQSFISEPVLSSFEFWALGRINLHHPRVASDSLAVPKTDRHSIKVTVGCQCNKCLQSHEATDACWWVLKELFAKKSLSANVFMEVLATWLCLDFSYVPLVCRVGAGGGLQMRLGFCPLCTYEPYLMCGGAPRVAPRPLAVSPYHHMDKQCGLSVSRLLWWPQLTRKLLVNKSGAKLRLALAAKYQLTAIGLWEIAAVGTRFSDF